MQHNSGDMGIHIVGKSGYVCLDQLSFQTQEVLGTEGFVVSL